jgi:hypothetical protein
MKHRISALALVLLGALCSPAQAAHWDAVLLTDLGLYHFDPHAISDKGGVKTIQALLDYKTPKQTAGGQTYRSSQSEIQLNCKTQAARIMHTAYFAGAMGAGKEVHKEGSVREWMDLVKGTPIERIAHRIC